MTLGGPAGCRSSNSSRKGPKVVVTPDLIREVRVALNFLPPVVGETFRDFLPRARAAMLLADSKAVRMASRQIPEDPLLFVGGDTNAFFPVILAEWAMRRDRQNRVALLSKLTQLRTDGAHLDPTDPRAPRRKNGKPYPADPLRFRAQLRSQAVRMGLRFSVFDDTIVEVGQTTRGKVTPKIALSSVLVARGDTPPLRTEEGWVDPPFSGAMKADAVIGRGTLLAKGPLVAALYALDAVIDSGVPFARPPQMLIDLASGQSRPRQREALRRKDDKRTPLPTPALDRFFEERGRPARAFVADSHYFSTGLSAGLARLELKSGASQFGPASAERYRLVVVNAEANVGALPALASALWLIPDGDAETSGSAVPAALTALFPDAPFTRQGRAVQLELTAAPGAAYATEGPRGAGAELGRVLKKLEDNGLLSVDGCAALLLAMAKAQTTSAATSVLQWGATTIDDDGRCTVEATLLWTDDEEGQQRLATLRADLPKDATVDVVTRRNVHRTSPPKVVVDAAQEATRAYSELDPNAAALWSAHGTRDVSLLRTERGIGLGPLTSLSRAVADAPNESITIDEFDELVAIYAYALARAGR